jgi:hypothetical protein
MLDPVLKEWIDNASYEQLFYKWRFAPIGDPLFQGETGDYFTHQLTLKREPLTLEERVAISKRLSWK